MFVKKHSANSGYKTIFANAYFDYYTVIINFLTEKNEDTNNAA